MASDLDSNVYYENKVALSCRANDAKTDKKIQSHFYFKVTFTISGKMEGALQLPPEFISPRCLEPVGLTKSLAQKCIVSINAANSGFF